MSNITEKLRQVEEQSSKDTLRIKKLERLVQEKSNWQLWLVRALFITIITAGFMSATGISLEENIIAIGIPPVGYIVMEFAARIFQSRISR